MAPLSEWLLIMARLPRLPPLRQPRRAGGSKVGAPCKPQETPTLWRLPRAVGPAKTGVGSAALLSPCAWAPALGSPLYSGERNWVPTKMRIPPSRFWVQSCPCSAVFVPSPLHTLRCSPAHTHFGTRSPLSSTTFWQRGLSSLARPIRPAPPGAGKAAEFRCSSTRSSRCLNCAGVSEMVEEPADVGDQRLVRVHIALLPHHPGRVL